MTTTEHHYAETSDARRERIAALVALQEPIDHVLELLPPGLPLIVTDEGVQVCRPTGDQINAVEAALPWAKWKARGVPYEPDKVNHETEVSGVRVLLYACEP